ncbi:unnamed protein product [Chrysoparadoxa australica]
MILELVYQDLPSLQLADAWSAGLELVSKEEEVAELLSKVDKKTASKLQEMTGKGKTGEVMVRQRHALQEIVTSAVSTSKLSEAEALLLQESTDARICCEFGDHYEDWAIAEYERQYRDKIVFAKNDRRLVWPFPKPPISNWDALQPPMELQEGLLQGEARAAAEANFRTDVVAKLTRLAVTATMEGLLEQLTEESRRQLKLEFPASLLAKERRYVHQVAEHLGLRSSSKNLWSGERQVAVFAHDDPAAAVPDAVPDVDESTSELQSLPLEGNKGTEAVVSPMDQTISMPEAPPSPAPPMPRSQASVRDEGEPAGQKDIGGVTGVTEVSATHDPFFAITGFVDGVTEEVACCRDPDAWKFRRVVLEVKTRVNGIHSGVPPPLYDIVQLVCYCIMLGAEEGDLVEGERREEEKEGEVKIRTTRVKLNDPVYKHEYHWRHTVVPHLYEVTALVRWLREPGQASQRLSLLLAEPDERMAWLSTRLPFLDGRPAQTRTRRGGRKRERS